MPWTGGDGMVPVHVVPLPLARRQRVRDADAERAGTATGWCTCTRCLRAWPRIHHVSVCQHEEVRGGGTRRAPARRRQCLQIHHRQLQLAPAQDLLLLQRVVSPPSRPLLLPHADGCGPRYPGPAARGQGQRQGHGRPAGTSPSRRSARVAVRRRAAGWRRPWSCRRRRRNRWPRSRFRRASLLPYVCANWYPVLQVGPGPACPKVQLDSHVGKTRRGEVNTGANVRASLTVPQILKKPTSLFQQGRRLFRAPWADHRRRLLPADRSRQFPGGSNTLCAGNLRAFSSHVKRTVPCTTVCVGIRR
ncbi:uncharacterized protein [Miscanthus floridulus]|uniref:uncharacterized protein n=1 Tax=Miscanthus floridulus TaxID=154761 RepID=UPI0034576C24